MTHMTVASDTSSVTSATTYHITRDILPNLLNSVEGMFHQSREPMPQANVLIRKHHYAIGAIRSLFSYQS